MSPWGFSVKYETKEKDMEQTKEARAPSPRPRYHLAE